MAKQLSFEADASLFSSKRSSVEKRLKTGGEERASNGKMSDQLSETQNERARQLLAGALGVRPARDPPRLVVDQHRGGVPPLLVQGLRKHVPSVALYRVPVALLHADPAAGDGGAVDEGGDEAVVGDGHVGGLAAGRVVGVEVDDLDVGDGAVVEVAAEDEDFGGLWKMGG